MSGSARVAVVGLGVFGISALKNLLEEGYEVVGFEKKNHIGGLWKHDTDQTTTTVLPTTVTNISKQRNSYTDYPFPEAVPDHATAAQLQQYLEDFAEHFALSKHYRLGVTLEKIDRTEDGSAWALTFIEDGVSKTETFGKVMMTNGTYQSAFQPKIDGMEKFRGKVIHSQAFKNPMDFSKKRVLVVGLSNTGGDTAVALSKIAEKVYISHSSGVRLVKRRTPQDTPLDHMLTRRLAGIAITINKLAPRLSYRLASFVADMNMKKSFPNLRPEWNLLPAPPISHATPVMNDHVIDLLEEGSVISVPGICRIRDSETVEFNGGSTICVDTIIFATGYRFDFNLFPPSIDPSARPFPEWDAAPYSNGMAYPNLYMGLLHPEHADSLAFLGCYRGSTTSAMINADLASQAIAQIWKGAYPLPSLVERQRWCEKQYRFSIKQVQIYRIHKPTLPPGMLEPWLNAAAGNGVNEKLGWGFEGWKFWWKEHGLYRLIMDGVDTPFVYRLFDGRRRKWEGARAAIEQINEAAKKKKMMKAGTANKG